MLNQAQKVIWETELITKMIDLCNFFILGHTKC
jgi:hypothetical protein